MPPLYSEACAFRLDTSPAVKVVANLPPSLKSQSHCVAHSTLIVTLDRSLAVRGSRSTTSLTVVEVVEGKR